MSMFDEMRKQNAFGGAFNHYRTIRKEQIAVSCTQIARRKSRRFAFCAKKTGKVRHVGRGDGFSCRRFALEIPQVGERYLMCDMAGMRTHN